MQECYDANATFNDLVFVNLNAPEVKAMWEMFCVKSKDLVIEYKNINANDTKGSAEWMATYTFTKTGRKVVNLIVSDFTFENGKIKNHTDSFNFYKWASQALGMAGILLGWSGFLKNQIRDEAKRSLKKIVG